MHRTRLDTIAPLVLVFALVAGCSDMPSNPSPVGPQAEASRSDAPKAERKKDHAFKSKADAIYLDADSLLLHDGAGKEVRLTAEQFRKLRRDFAKVAGIDAMYDRLKSDGSYQSCLKKAKESGRMTRLVRTDRPATSLGGFSPNALSMFRAPTGGPSRVIAVDDPTFCQEVAMGLYNANAAYEQAKTDYFKALLAGALGGATINGTSFWYDPSQVFNVVGTLTIDWYGYAFGNATIEVGIWGTWFNLGHCGADGAQYGYHNPPSSGGGGETGGLSAGCVYQDVVIELSNDGGNTWYKYYSGSAIVCN